MGKYVVGNMSCATKGPYVFAGRDLSQAAATPAALRSLFKTRSMNAHLVEVEAVLNSQYLHTSGSTAVNKAFAMAQCQYRLKCTSMAVIAPVGSHENMGTPLSQGTGARSSQRGHGPDPGRAQAQEREQVLGRAGTGHRTGRGRGPERGHCHDLGIEQDRVKGFCKNQAESWTWSDLNQSLAPFGIGFVHMDDLGQDSNLNLITNIDQSDMVKTVEMTRRQLLPLYTGYDPD